MAREPFSGNAGGPSGVSGYNTTDARSPALGRSSRDLVSDTGPGAAAEGLFTTPNTDTETTTGTGRDRTTGNDAIPRDRKTNPDVDPDTRLGLRPATGGMVAPRQPAYPISSPRTRMITGAVAGLIGSAVAATAWYAIHWAGVASTPPSLVTVSVVMGLTGIAAVALGLIASILAGGFWGGVYGLAVTKPSIPMGMLFGLLPALFQWVVLAPLSRQPLFFGGTAVGIALPVLFCVLVWGGITGYYAGRWLRPPYSGAVDPDLTTQAT